MMNCLKIRVCHFDDRREEKSFQQLGRKRPRLFPQLISPARETRANGVQRGALHCSPLDSPAPLSPLQAAEISYFKSKIQTETLIPSHDNIQQIGAALS